MGEYNNQEKKDDERFKTIKPKCIDDYTVLEWTNLTKLYVFAAKEKVNTYSEKLFSSNDCLSIWGGSPVKFMTSRETQE